MAFQPFLLYPGPEIAPPVIDREFHVWLHDLVDEIRRMGEAIGEGGVTDISSLLDQLIYTEYAYRVAEPILGEEGLPTDDVGDLLENTYFPIPNNYVKGSMQIYWDRRLMYKKTDYTQDLGIHEFAEVPDDDDKYNQVFFYTGIKRDSILVFRYLIDPVID